METEPIPANWEAIVCPAVPYWWGMDTLESHWARTEPFVEDAPGSDAFQEFMFWRRISVIWTCSTIEAFVNSEGTAWLGERFYKDNLERLGILQKIHTLYALKYHVRLPPKLNRLSHVAKLFDLRNSLVHPKTRETSEQGARDNARADELRTMEFEHLRKVLWTVTALFEPDGVGETEEDAANEQCP